jgi:hypothetical protein
MELAFPPQIIKKYSDIKFNSNLTGSSIIAPRTDGRTDRQTDRHDEANRLFAILRTRLKVKIYRNRIRELKPNPADIQTLTATSSAYLFISIV